MSGTNAKVQRLLNGTLAGQIALTLDRADKNPDNNIQEGAWNSIFGKKKKLNCCISTENAMKSIMTYAVAESKRTGKSIDDIAKEWLEVAKQIERNNTNNNKVSPKADNKNNATPVKNKSKGAAAPKAQVQNTTPGAAAPKAQVRNTTPGAAVPKAPVRNTTPGAAAPKAQVRNTTPGAAAPKAQVRNTTPGAAVPKAPVSTADNGKTVNNQTTNSTLLVLSNGGKVRIPEQIPKKITPPKKLEPKDKRMNLINKIKKASENNHTKKGRAYTNKKTGMKVHYNNQGQIIKISDEKDKPIVKVVRYEEKDENNNTISKFRYIMYDYNGPKGRLNQAIQYNEDGTIYDYQEYKYYTRKNGKEEDRLTIWRDSNGNIDKEAALPITYELDYNCVRANSRTERVNVCNDVTVGSAEGYMDANVKTLKKGGLQEITAKRSLQENNARSRGDID